MKPADEVKTVSERLEGFMPIEEYARIALGTGFFKDVEIDVLREVIGDYRREPGKDYFFFHETAGKEPAGFIIFGRTPMTDCGWDIYWIAVGKDFQSTGIGRKLLKRTEDFILKKDRKAILRIETSGKKEYDTTQHFYKKTGFVEAGRIPDFYSAGDSMVNYYKTIER